MRIVALDTSSEYGSFALVEDGKVVEQVALRSPEGFGHVLFLELDKLMKRHGWHYREVDGYAAGAGPGSFTGVRVGLAAVKGLADAAGVRAAAISTLQAMSLYGSQPLRAPLLDARRSEVYGGLYNDQAEPMEDEVVTPLAVWLERLPFDAEILTPAPELVSAVVGTRLVTTTPRELAGAIGQLAGDRLQDPIAIDANYVRRSDAELFWKES